ncbi:hypothetical protein GPEL0_01r2678 [Geoanaerobacter pelophilus]|uniref:Uncharacterized protein n=1 Tax=Geoanaerobacter pelophilus TaxID=60036 RepID=A0ABQ0MIY9_9BACT|nr:hypothetical protein GPEL0_01r2678 [Geoanaerobacter pelophilus]
MQIKLFWLNQRQKPKAKASTTEGTEEKQNPFWSRQRLKSKTFYH